MGKTSYFKYLNVNGADIFTVVSLPEREGKFPTIIYRTPYVDAFEQTPEEEICEILQKEHSFWLDAGYAVVYQHCRGRGKSSGDCVPYVYEREDGLNLREWIRQQSFYNGELFLCGGSYTASVHFVTAPFEEDVKGAFLAIMDCELYSLNYRNGIFKMGLIGGWYVGMYKKKSIFKKNFTPETYKMLPLSDFSQTVFGERAEHFDKILQHPDRDDPFWLTEDGGVVSHEALKHIRIPVLLMTGHYDIFTGGIYNMWKEMDEEARSMCALVVHPYSHGGVPDDQPVAFERGKVEEQYPDFKLRWIESVRGKCEPPVQLGKISYYKSFGDGWHCDDFYDADEIRRIGLGQGRETYTYNPFAPAYFRGGLSVCFGGTAWQAAPGRYDVITRYTEEFDRDTFIKGQIRAKLRVASDCEDTAFYIRLSLCKEEGDYGLRDDINQISNLVADYKAGDELDMEFSFDEHAFVVKKGEKIRIDIASSGYPNYIPHTNQKGLFSAHKTAKIAHNTVILDESYIELPIRND